MDSDEEWSRKVERELAARQISATCERANAEGADPVDILESFCLAVEHELPIPPELAHYVADCFRSFVEQAGRTSLDREFSVTSPGRGRSPAITSWHLDARNLELTLEIEQLRRYLGVTREEATAMVSARFEAESGGTLLEPRWLEELYDKHGPWDDAPRETKDGVTQAILSRYPRRCLPPRFRG